MNQYVVAGFLSYTIGILVFFVHVNLTRKIALLRKYHIPEPVTGGLIAAIVVYLIYLLTGTEISFELETRDILLVYFFTYIGINARLSDLVTGGKPLLVLLGLTLAFIVIQDVIGLTGAALVGAPSPVGIMAGSASLMGRNYQAAVLSAGFGGFALGATPTAIANMTAVTKSHGPAPMAFIILPLVAAFLSISRTRLSSKQP